MKTGVISGTRIVKESHVTLSHSAFPSERFANTGSNFDYLFFHHAGSCKIMLHL